MWAWDVLGFFVLVSPWSVGWSCSGHYLVGVSQGVSRWGCLGGMAGAQDGLRQWSHLGGKLGLVWVRGHYLLRQQVAQVPGPCSHLYC